MGSRPGVRVRLDALSRRANRLAEAVVAMLLGGMAILVGVQVAGRFLFAYSIPWSDELARFLLVWISFLGLSAAARHGAHPGIATVVRVLSSRGARLVGGLALLLSLLFIGLVAIYGTELAIRTWGQRSPSLGLRMSWPYLAVPVSAVLVLLHWAATGDPQAADGRCGEAGDG